MNAYLKIVYSPAHVELTLNRPERRNALSRELIADLTATLRRCGEDHAVGSVILTGAGSAFCAGLDLGEVDRAAGEQANLPLLTLLETIERLPKPVIAAVNGPAVAGGAALASACDLAICAESASLGCPGVKRGLVAPLVVTYLCRLVGERHAKFLMLTAETVPARRALEMGLVNEVVADAELLGRARAYAAGFAECPPDALAETKALFVRLRRLQADADAIRRLHAALWRSPASAAGPADSDGN